MDVLSPEEKKSEHRRRVKWLSMMERAPICCKNGTSMETLTLDVYRCGECGRTWEKINGIMYCTEEGEEGEREEL